MTARTESPERTHHATDEMLVDALGLAWAAFTLYENPTGIDSFHRAVGTLAQCPRYPYVFHVGPDGFHDGGAPIAHRREATLRLARRVFGAASSGIEVGAPPTAEAVLGLFRIVAAADESVDPNPALRRQGITKISLLYRSVEGEDGDEKDDGKPWYLSYDGDPEPFITGLLSEADGDAAAAAAAFVAEYERVCELLDPGDRWAADEVIHSFVDAFWYLPGDHRSRVFSMMLERRHRSENLAFLDQFGSMELAEMNESFGEAGHPLLAEYLRVAAEEGGRQTTDLTGPGTRAPGSLGRAVIEQVASVLSSTDPNGTPATEAALERLRAQAPANREHAGSAINVVRGMLALAGGETSMEAAASVWAMRVASALAAGSVEGAAGWIKAISGLELTQTDRVTMASALTLHLDEAGVTTLIDLLAHQPGDAAGRLVARLAPVFATPALIDRLGAAPDRNDRRRIMDALVPLVKVDPAPAVRRLDDPRWYLVRNLVLVLGRTGRVALVPRFAGALRHEDPRVRVEALRALKRLGAPEATPRLLEALDDPETADAAVEMLARTDDPAIDTTLEEMLGRSDANAAVAVAALARRSSESARAILESTASARFAWFGRRRLVKRLAARALEAIDA